jgi:iron complex outermembrane receptor protein
MHRRGNIVTSFSNYFPTAKKLRVSFAAACLAGTALVSPVLAQDGGSLPSINVDATRLGATGIVGASTAVITAEDIARSPGQTIQDVLATIPGVQVQSLFGGVNGVNTTVDVRGFGAFASANTLVLINGRRINDLDLAGVDLSTIPLQSIERIEVTKGNSGAVLYGDNAIGGVINIITKTGVGGKPIQMRVEGGVGSFNSSQGNVSVTTNHGPWSSAAFANAFKSDGYRVNNKTDQRNAVGEVRYTTPDFSAFLNLSGDDQHIGLPGGRTVNAFVNELVNDRRGATTPFDFADKQGANATAGFTKSLWNGAELIVDGGVRHKLQQGSFFGTFADNYVDSALTTWSITPRLSIKNDIFGLRSNILTGIDYYDAKYNSDRSKSNGLPPIHAYDLSQQTIAGYWQQTIGLLSTTDVSYGARVQNVSVSAKDRYDPTAPTQPFYSSAQDAPLNSNEIQHALHAGIEHRFTNSFAVFARAARAFRTPNVDERVGAGLHFDPNNFFAPVSSNFALKTQTSYDVEGGFRVRAGRFELQSSIYDMHLKNEIHFNPFLGYNLNLDPTHRYGSETSFSLAVTDTFRLRGGVAYTRAVFEEGAFTGNDVPLVSRVSGNLGATWDIWQKYAVLDANVRMWGSRRMDNDQRNNQLLIPANATLDVKLSGQYDRFFWSASVINVFDTLYYDYAVASQFTSGAYSAYPLPGRVYMLKAGVTF